MSESHYHYSREERLSQKERSGRQKSEHSGSIFRRNRSLTIVLLDLSVLLIVFGIWWAFLRTPADSTTIGEFRVELGAGVETGRTYATLTLRNIGDDRSGALFDVRFTGVDGDSLFELSDRDVLPVPGDIRLLRSEWDRELEEVRAQLNWEGGSGSIRTRVR